MVPLELNPLTGGPFIDDAYQTKRPGVFICGNAAFVNDLADYVSSEAEIAGEAAADYVNGTLKSEMNVITVAGENVRFIVPNVITRAKPLTLYARVTRPIKDAAVSSPDGTIKLKKNIVKPGEMLEIHLDGEKLAKLKGSKELKIDVRAD
jgi:hypothetical protein